MILLLLLVLLAIAFGGFFVFALKWAIIIAIIVFLVGALGGYRYRS